MSINLGPAYNFEKNSVNTRPDYVKSYAAKVKALCKKGVSRKNAEKEADSQLGSVKEWIASERIEGRSGNIYRGSPPTSVTTSPRLSTAPATRPGSPYSLNSNNRKTRRTVSRKSKKSKKSKKT